MEARSTDTLMSLLDDVKRVSDIYAARFDLQRDDMFYVGKLVEELGEMTQAYLRLAGLSRTKGEPRERLQQSLEDEAADVLGMLLLFADRTGVDLAAGFERKWRRYLPADDTRQQ